MNSDRSDTTIGLPVLDSEDLGEQGNLLVVVLVGVARVRDQVNHVHRFIKRAMRFDSTYFAHSFLCNRLIILVSKKATETRYPLFHAPWKYLFYFDQGVRALVGFALVRVFLLNVATGRTVSPITSRPSSHRHPLPLQSAPPGTSFAQHQASPFPQAP
jgi:hypothetical protein